MNPPEIKSSQLDRSHTNPQSNRTFTSAIEGGHSLEQHMDDDIG
eukprot:CAMPEP_0202977508 /NCGR_PEP_ID=MMETSP1396-20130829/84286_1 /ASSEMBLY_ACC=CAM_ASM_000872 /TAXON_ID= /ORGANISM="Pseudokeronopsis sp., Strain Brazil" /LENGTH=43 /DNA_ID= /DNA_START= /DNA_END= /DNA_ORIENTATION=